MAEAEVEELILQVVDHQAVPGEVVAHSGDQHQLLQFQEELVILLLLVHLKEIQVELLQIIIMLVEEVVEPQLSEEIQ